jgi:proline dehydrogenase
VKIGIIPDCLSKILTDQSYNSSIETILRTLKQQLDSDKASTALSVIFGTHNTESVGRIIHTLEAEGLAKKTDDGSLRMRKDVSGRVNVAQLYGMFAIPSGLTHQV